MLRALAALGDWPLTQVFACGFRILRNPTFAPFPSALAPRIESSLHFNTPAPHPLLLPFRFAYPSLMCLPFEQPLDGPPDKTWKHHPEKEQKPQEKANAHQRQKSGWVNKQFVGEETEERDQR